jgi:hypothetical protein
MSLAIFTNQSFQAHCQRKFATEVIPLYMKPSQLLMQPESQILNVNRATQT